MDDTPLHDPRILESLEACRPGSDDLAQPEMRDLAAELAASPELDQRYDRLQRLDASMAAAFQDVPVPAGLEERLLARLRTEAAGDTPDAAPEAAGPAGKASRRDDSAALADPSSPVPTRNPRSTTGRASRRRLLAIVVFGGVAAIALVGLVVPHVLNPPIEGTVNLAEAIDQFTRDDEGRLWGTGQSLDSAPLGQFPLPITSPPVYSQISWRSIRGFLAPTGVAYDLVSRQGVRATLYVIPMRAAGVPSSPPASPALATGNCAAAAWQAGGLLYVLVVHGGSQQYQQFFEDSGGPYT